MDTLFTFGHRADSAPDVTCRTERTVSAPECPHQKVTNARNCNVAFQVHVLVDLILSMALTDSTNTQTYQYALTKLNSAVKIEASATST